MRKFYAGIDSGSTRCKAVLFDGENIVDALVMKTGWNPESSARECLGLLLGKNSIPGGGVRVAVTGYGRGAIPFADHIFTEITCHAFGGMYLAPDIQGVIDIGGQDSKVIQIGNNKVVNFLMNDKCAAGTGRFLNMACETLGVPPDGIDQFADPVEAVSVNSMCAVFAESEIIGLLSMREDRAKIMAGVLDLIARRIWQMTGKTGFAGGARLLMTGGLANSSALVKSISRTTGLSVITHEYSLFAGAVGACICAGNKEAPRPPS